MTTARWLALGVLALLVVFAFRGGPFTAGEYAELTRQEAAMKARIEDLEHEVDSLRAFRDSLETSPIVQERVAREQWGWIRPGEISVRITDGALPDSTKGK